MLTPHARPRTPGCSSVLAVAPTYDEMKMRIGRAIVRGVGRNSTAIVSSDITPCVSIGYSRIVTSPEAASTRRSDRTHFVDDRACVATHAIAERCPARDDPRDHAGFPGRLTRRIVSVNSTLRVCRSRFAAFIVRGAFFKPRPVDESWRSLAHQAARVSGGGARSGARTRQPANPKK